MAADPPSMARGALRLASSAPAAQLDDTGRQVTTAQFLPAGG